MNPTSKKHLLLRIALVIGLGAVLLLGGVIFSSAIQTRIIKNITKGQFGEVGLEFDCESCSIDFFSKSIDCSGITLHHDGLLIFNSKSSYMEWQRLSPTQLIFEFQALQINEGELDVVRLNNWQNILQSSEPYNSDNSVESTLDIKLIINELELSNIRIHYSENETGLLEVDTCNVASLSFQNNSLRGRIQQITAATQIPLFQLSDGTSEFRVESCSGDFAWHHLSTWEFDGIRLQSNFADVSASTQPDGLNTEVMIEPEWSEFVQMVPDQYLHMLTPLNPMPCEPNILASVSNLGKEGMQWKIQLDGCEQWALATDYCVFDAGIQNQWKIQGSWNLSHLMRGLKRLGMRDDALGMTEMYFSYLTSEDLQIEWDFTAEEQRFNLINNRSPRQRITAIGQDSFALENPRSFRGTFRSISIPLQGFQSSPWSGDYELQWLDGPMNAGLNAQLTGQNESGETITVKLNGQSTSNATLIPEGSLEGQITIKTKELPIDLIATASWDSAGWSASGELGLSGLKDWTTQGDSTWQLFANASIRASGKTEKDWDFSFETRDINLLENGQPRAFKRLDFIGSRNDEELLLEWNSDISDGMAQFKNPQLAFNLDFNQGAQGLQSAFDEGLEMVVEGNIHRFKPIQLLANLPFQLDPHSKVKAKLNAQEASFEVDLPKVVGSDWEARQLNIRGTLDQGIWHSTAEMETLILSKDTLALGLRARISGSEQFEASIDWKRPHQANSGFIDFSFTAPWEETGELVLQNIEWPMMNQVFVLQGETGRMVWNTSDGSLELSPFRIASSDWSLLLHGQLSEAIGMDLNLHTQSATQEIQMNSESTTIGFESVDSWIHVCGSFLRPELESETSIIGLDWSNEHFGQIQLRFNGPLDHINTDMQVNWKDDAFASATAEVNLLQREVIAMDLEVEEFPLATLRFILPEETLGFEGTARGRIEGHGPWDAITLKGGLAVDSARIAVPYLGTEYEASGFVNITPSSIELNQWNIKDINGHQAKLNGTLCHDAFTKWDVDFGIDANEEAMTMIDLEPAIDQLFFGTALGQGDVNISGFGENLVIDAHLTAGEGTQFALPLDAVTDATYASFIRFESIHEIKPPRKPASEFSNVQMNLSIDVDPEAEARIIFDQNVGDEIIGRCEGHIDLTVDDFERLEMTGDLTVVEGAYYFTLQNLINKRFDILPGGTISWFGDPYEAEIDLSAIYQVRSSLEGLLPNVSDLPGAAQVQLSLSLEGSLLAPSIGFDIQIPDASSRIQSLVTEALTNEEELQRQAISLLVINQFISPDPFMATVGGFLNKEQSSELLVNQIGHWISQLSSTLDVGVDYSNDQSSGEQELALALSTQLLNDRMHIEGAVGAQGVGQLNPSGIQIQDFTISYDLDPEGHYQITGHSKSNRLMNNAFDGTTTQGVGIRMRREFDRWGDWRSAPNELVQ